MDEYTTQVIAGVHLLERNLVKSYGGSGTDRSYENPANPIDPPYQGGNRSQAGTYVTPATAMQIDAVWACVSIISGDVGKLRLKLKRDGEPVDTPLARTVGVTPNEVFNRVRFWSRTMQHVLIWGNAWIWISPSGRLYHLLPDRTRYWSDAHQTSSNPNDYWIVSEHDGTLVPYSRDEVIHIDWMGSMHMNNYEGVPVYEAARESWGLALARQGFASQFFARGGRIGGMLKVPDWWDQASKDKWENAFRQKYEAGRAHETMLLREGLNFIPAQRSPAESQLTSLSADTRIDVAMRYGVPPSRLGVPGAASYGSLAEEKSAYVSGTLGFWLNQIESELNKKLLRDRRGIGFEFDTHQLLMADLPSHVETLSSAVSSMLMTPNEGREKLGMKPLPGGDGLLNPNTVSDVPDTGRDDSGDQDQEQEQQEAEGRHVSHAVLRSVMVLTENARFKAERGRGALEAWCGDGCKRERQVVAGLLGAAIIVDEFAERVREVVAQSTPADLYERIDRLCHDLEVRILGVTSHETDSLSEGPGDSRAAGRQQGADRVCSGFLQR